LAEKVTPNRGIAVEQIGQKPGIEIVCSFALAKVYSLVKARMEQRRSTALLEKLRHRDVIANLQNFTTMTVLPDGVRLTRIFSNELKT
jgi:hypothetical protein